MVVPKINEGRRTILAIGAVILMVLSNHAALSCRGRTMLRIGGLTEYDQQLIVEMHNRMRQSVALGRIHGQPPASNMMEMKWDNQLANKAQEWSTTCEYAIHDNRRHTARYLVGQNIASTWTTKPPSTYYEMKADFAGDAIGKWFDEFHRFRFGGFGRGSGHYTQMVWAETNLIGCGFAFYFDPNKGFTKNYVCNYGPSGNVRGESPYTKGYPKCYAYGLADSRKYAGLCDNNKGLRYFYDGSSNYIG